jgi:Putative addiction module component
LGVRRNGCPERWRKSKKKLWNCRSMTELLFAAKLLRTLEGISEAENERLWFAEAERRQREMQGGLVEALPGEEVLRRVAADIS